MYILYGSQATGSAIAEAALALCQQPYRVERASSWEADSAQAALLAVNPLGQIPSLVLPDGSVLTESAAIVMHLGLSFPDSGLLPSDPSLRAQALRGLVYLAANCYAAIGVIDFPERFCTQLDEATRKHILAGTRAQLHRCWDLFADTFPGQPFLLGDAPCGLDLMAAVVSKWSGTRAHLGKTRPQLLALLQATEAHPRFAGVLQQHWPPQA